MNKAVISSFLKKTRYTLGKHSPEILTGIGITGLLSTTVLAVKATPKALYLMEQRKKEENVDELTVKEVIVTTWKCYIPSVLTASFSVGCLIGASTVNTKRNAALATAYTLSETALKEYQEKVIETIGEKKETAIRDSIAKDKVQKDPVVNKEVIITEKGHTLCYDQISGRYFESDMDILKKAENELNKRLISEMYLSLNEFYYEIGLRGTSFGEETGWNINDGLIELSYSAQIADDDRPCIVIDYQIAPRYDFSKLM